jgi:hypothetical protein
MRKLTVQVNLSVQLLWQLAAVNLYTSLVYMFTNITIASNESYILEFQIFIENLSSNIALRFHTMIYSNYITTSN